MSSVRSAAHLKAESIRIALLADNDQDLKAMVRSTLDEDKVLSHFYEALLDKLDNDIDAFLATAGEMKDLNLRCSDLGLHRVRLKTLIVRGAENLDKAWNNRCSTFMWLSEERIGTKNLRSRNDSLGFAVMRVVEWAFWMAMFGWLKEPISLLDSLFQDKERRRRAKVELQTVRKTMSEMLEMLGFQNLANIGARYIIKSIKPAMDCRFTGYVQSVGSLIAIQFSISSAPVGICLDSGAPFSSIDEGFLHDMNSKTVCQPLPQPFDSYGVGGGVVRTEKFAILEIYIPATVDGSYVLASISHQFEITSNAITRMLIGQDLITRHGIVMDPANEGIVITKCKGAKARLYALQGQIEQTPCSQDGKQ